MKKIFVIFFLLTTVWLGGCATYTPSKAEAKEEYQLNLRAKRAYTRTMEANASTTEANGASNCVAKNFGQDECVQKFGVQDLVPGYAKESPNPAVAKKEGDHWKKNCYTAGCHKKGARK